MKTYKDFIKHYGLMPNFAALRQYELYKKQLDLFNQILEEKTMKKLTISIDIENSAYDDIGELARTLHSIADDLFYFTNSTFCEGSKKVYDVNGNSVGFYKMEDKGND